MQYSNAWRIAVVVFCFCCGLSAQPTSEVTSAPQPKSTPPTATKKKPSQPKLTPQQEKGLRLLKTAEAASAGLAPPTRSYVLWEVSHGYRKVDSARADAILRRAFSATRGIEDEGESSDCHLDPCHVQRWLQREILTELLSASRDKAGPDAVEKLLSQATVEIKNQMLEQVATEFLRKRNFDRARQLLGQMDDDHYSYAVAGDLIAALPALRQDERLSVFSQAFRNFQSRSLEDLGPDDHDDFGVMVVRCWRELPDLALDAIDSIFERSQDRDQSYKAHSVTVTLFSGKSLSFGSEYEFRLFQFLPVLRELNPSKAEQLLAKYDKSRLALDQYPDGMKSLDPNYYGENPVDEKEMPSVSNIMPAVDEDPVRNSELQTESQIDAQIEAQMRNVMKESNNDPEKAYQDAMKLPLHGAMGSFLLPRASSLRQVAFTLIKQNPVHACAAMNEARRLVQDAAPSRQALFLADVPDFYLKLGDEDGARGAIRDQLKIAEKLYAIDSDVGDPNLVFKGAWPSANGWRNCIQKATKVSPAFAEEILAQIQDPDIAGLEQVMYANALLGAGKSSIAVVEWHKGGRHSGAFMTQ